MIFHQSICMSVIQGHPWIAACRKYKPQLYGIFTVPHTQVESIHKYTIRFDRHVMEKSKKDGGITLCSSKYELDKVNGWDIVHDYDLYLDGFLISFEFNLNCKQAHYLINAWMRTILGNLDVILPTPRIVRFQETCKLIPRSILGRSPLEWLIIQRLVQKGIYKIKVPERSQMVRFLEMTTKLPPEVHLMVAGWIYDEPDYKPPPQYKKEVAMVMLALDIDPVLLE